MADNDTPLQQDPVTKQFLPGNLTRWGPGQTGRMEGSRNKLSGLFYKDLLASWEEFGIDAIKATAITKPHEFVKIVASLMPKEFAIKSENVADLTDVDLEDAVEVLRAIAEKNRLEKDKTSTKILLGDGTTLHHSRPRE